MHFTKVLNSKALRIVASIFLVLMLIPVGAIPKIALGDSNNENNAESGNTQQSITYNFQFYFSNDESSDPNIKLEATDQESGTLPANTYTKDGFAFAGWSNTKDGNDIADDSTTEANEYVKAYKFADKAAYNGQLSR